MVGVQWELMFAELSEKGFAVIFVIKVVAKWTTVPD